MSQIIQTLCVFLICTIAVVWVLLKISKLLSARNKQVCSGCDKKADCPLRDDLLRNKEKKCTQFEHKNN